MIARYIIYLLMCYSASCHYGLMVRTTTMMTDYRWIETGLWRGRYV